MKISNSKKQLAKIIHENGGWREGNYAVQDKDDRRVWFMRQMVGKPSGRNFWPGVKSKGIPCSKVLPNWHQTILSRDEYFHLYPVAETKPEPVVETKLTIEQLAADYRNRKDYAERKQQEADAAKADAEAKLAELVAAGKAHGLVLSVAGPEPELVITDWRDLQVGDEVALTAPNGGGVNVGEVGVIRRIDGSSMSVNFPSQTGHLISRSIANWMFIRRPSKGEANA